MKTKILFIALIVPVLLTGCIQDCITDPSASATTMTITADLPGESANVSGTGEDMPGTRVGLTQDGLNVKSTWEVDDKIYLVFAEGTTAKGKQTVTLTSDNIKNDGKKASFSITIPGTITADNFNLYGVYGGSGFNGETYDLNLSNLAWSGTLTEVQNKDLMLLRFAAEGISKSSPSFTVAFAHVGSLFHIALKNSSTSTTLSGITKAELTAETAIQAHQNGGSATYNPVDGTFSGTTTTGTSLPFDLSTSQNLAAGSTLDFWGWYPPQSGQNWPELSLKIIATGGPYTSIDTKAARATATAAGKAYHFYANYDGTELYFTNSARTEGYLIDTRDNNVYKTITIGTQIWMAENLAYLPSVVGPATGSSTVPYYYVSGCDGTDVAAAKANDNYTTYGVLYNCPAAMNGAASSYANPSGVQGICPTGWHLPSEAEWTQLTDYLGGTSVAGGKMKEAGIAHWCTPNAGTTNSSGFTALAGGSRDSNGTFYNVIYAGYWWSSTETSTNFAWNGFLYYQYINFTSYSNFKDNGYSVRCVRD